LTGMPFYDYLDSPIMVRYDDDGNLVVDGMDSARAEQAGLSLPSLNIGSTQSRYVDLTKALVGYTAPVTNGVNPSLRVSINPIIYDTDAQYKVFVGTPTQASKPDLTAYVPTAGNHRVVHIWLDTYHILPVVTASTPQAITSTLDNSDVREAWQGRFNDYVPLQAFRLGNAQQSVTLLDMWRDHRQWVDTPQIVGTQSTLSVNTRVWDNRQYRVQGILDVSSYMMVAEAGSMVIVD